MTLLDQNTNFNPKDHSNKARNVNNRVKKVQYKVCAKEKLCGTTFKATGTGFPNQREPKCRSFFQYIYKPYAQQDCHIKMISRRWRHLVEADKLPLQLLANRSNELPKLQNSLAVTTFFICFGYERLDCELGLVARQVVLCKRTLL